MSYNKVDTLPRSVAEAIHARRLDRATWADIEHEFEISSPRAKMLLAKHGLDHSPLGDLRCAESQPAESIAMWERPCINCGSKERRRRFLFRCKACRREGREDYNAADSMYAGGMGCA